MRNKAYTAPEADVEKFTITAQVMTSGDPNGGLDYSENVGSGEGAEITF